MAIRLLYYDDTMPEERKNRGGSDRFDSPDMLLGSGDQFNLLELSSDLVCTFDEGKIIYINGAGARILEATTPAELIGRDFADFIAPEYYQAVDGLFATLSEDKETLPCKLIGLAGGDIGVEMNVFHAPAWGKGAFTVFAHNVTESVRMAKAVNRSEARLRGLINNALDLICVCEKGIVTFINNSGLKMLGLPTEDQIIGHPFSDIVHHNYRDLFSDGICHVIAEGELFPVKLLRVDGNIIDVELAVTAVDPGPDSDYMIEARDITEHNKAVMSLRENNETLERRVLERTRQLSDEVAVRKQAEEKLIHMASHDSLTGLPNRALLVDRLVVALAGARRKKKTLAVMFIDLDGFKAVNDSLGHDVGDEVLKEVAGRLLACTRASDTVARLGGDEFIIVLGNIANTDNVAHVGENILNALKEPVVVDGVGAIVGCSIGIAMFPDHANTPEDLLAKADAAMYKVKQSGRNGWLIASE